MAWLMFAAHAAAQTPQVPPPGSLPAVTALPFNWAALPLFAVPIRTDGANVTAYVESEVKAGRCKVVPDDAGVSRLDVPVAILVGSGGTVRQVIPQAIDCPTVEQFTVGYVSTLARSALAVDRDRVRPGWYRLPVAYQWQG